ncbi:hypothetical protein IWQ62_000352 [Dispira parvispora]|uniref:Uncharacterized protein n=1 Tax=Dispira parvispora TaxID=1520584 RepID=A0A9W8E9B7_9FUNG|nr:hypothetical protein IWQ62_000352 [Dispira parvispora]
MSYNNVSSPSVGTFKVHIGNATTTADQGVDIKIRLVPESFNAQNTTATTQVMQRNVGRYQKTQQSRAPLAAPLPKTNPSLVNPQPVTGICTKGKSAKQKKSKGSGTFGWFKILRLVFGGSRRSKAAKSTTRHTASTTRVKPSSTRLVTPMEERVAIDNDECLDMDGSAIWDAMQNNNQPPLNHSTSRPAMAYPAIQWGAQSHTSNTYSRAQAAYPRPNHNSSATRSTHMSNTSNVHGGSMHSQVNGVHWQDRSTSPTTSTSTNQRITQRNTHANSTVRVPPPTGLRNSYSTASIQGTNRERYSKASPHIRVDVTPASNPVPTPPPSIRPRPGDIRGAPRRNVPPSFPVMTGARKLRNTPSWHQGNYIQPGRNVPPNGVGPYNSLM